jgi:hypothetical protein
MKFNQYKKTLPTAQKIAKLIIPEIRTHKDFCDSINLSGKINRLLIEKD